MSELLGSQAFSGYFRSVCVWGGVGFLSLPHAQIQGGRNCVSGWAGVEAASWCGIGQNNVRLRRDWEIEREGLS